MEDNNLEQFIEKYVVEEISSLEDSGIYLPEFKINSYEKYNSNHRLHRNNR